jgi:hypothetical protein
MKRLFTDRPKGRLSAVVKLKRALLRIGSDGTREGFKLAGRVFKAIPELRGA